MPTKRKVPMEDLSLAGLKTRLHKAMVNGDAATVTIYDGEIAKRMSALHGRLVLPPVRNPATLKIRGGSNSRRIPKPKFARKRISRKLADLGVGVTVKNGVTIQPPPQIGDDEATALARAMVAAGKDRVNARRKRISTRLGID